MRTLLTCTVFAGLLAAPASAADLKLSDIAVIPIHGGVNTLTAFAPDGRTATIVEGWRDNGNAHGHSSTSRPCRARTAAPNRRPA